MGHSVLQRWTAFMTLVIMLVYSTTPASAIEVAGELFVDLNASTFSTGDATWTNAGSYADFEAIDGPARVDFLDAAPAVVFNGSTQAFVGGSLEDPEPAPEGLTGFDPTRSIEVWALNPGIASEETLVSWGKRGGPDGTNMAFNYGDHGNFGAVGHWGGGGPDLGWIDDDFTQGAPVANQWHHLTYTYGGEDDPFARVYSDGELWYEEDMGNWGFLNTHEDPAIAIASQWESDGVTLTGGLKGSLMIGQVRIHDGVLSDAQILSNYNAEKDNYVNPEPPKPPEPAAIPAGPIHRYSFSNDASGDASGAEIVDSVGGANGIVLGEGSSLSGDQLILDGGSSDFAAYVDLPNGLISPLTDVTIETWVTIEGIQSWSRIFDFGNNSPGGDDGELLEPGDDNGGETRGLDYLMLSASRGDDQNVHRVDYYDEDPLGGGTVTIDFTDPKELGDDRHYAVVLDSDGDELTGGGTLSVYSDGVLMGSANTSIALSNVDDVNNWLGRSNWTNDANFQGAYDEFRIYDYALTNDEILGNFEAGPDTVNTAASVAGDYNGDGEVNEADINLQAQEMNNAEVNLGVFDENDDGVVNEVDRLIWVQDHRQTWMGDADLDGLFSSGDLVKVFTAGKYETGEAASWGEGDWNGDLSFGSGDLVTAFTDGGYEAGARAPAAAVPEPSTLTLLLMVALSAFGVYRRRRE